MLDELKPLILHTNFFWREGYAYVAKSGPIPDSQPSAMSEAVSNMATNEAVCKKTNKRINKEGDWHHDYVVEEEKTNEGEGKDILHGIVPRETPLRSQKTGANVVATFPLLKDTRFSRFLENNGEGSDITNDVIDKLMQVGKRVST